MIMYCCDVTFTLNFRIVRAIDHREDRMKESRRWQGLIGVKESGVVREYIDN